MKFEPEMHAGKSGWSFVFIPTFGITNTYGIYEFTIGWAVFTLTIKFNDEAEW